MNANSSTFSVITSDIVRDILTRNRSVLVDITREAYRAFGQGAAINPHSTFLSFNTLKPDAADRIIALPAYLGGQVDVAGIKWVASFPQNLSLNVPRASAVLILNEMKTGRPLACIEGSLISASRTAASAILGAEIMFDGQRMVNKVGVIGTGFIAWTILQFFHELGWRFKEVVLFDRDHYKATRFAKNAAASESNLIASERLEDVITDTDLLILATTATQPWLYDLTKLSGSAKILNISLRDLDPKIIVAADNIVDDIDHCLRAQTSPHLAEIEFGSRNFSLSNIYEYLGPGATYLPAPQSRGWTVFSPFGLGVLDVAVGAFVYEEALRTNRAAVVPGFLPDMTEEQFLY